MLWKWGGEAMLIYEYKFGVIKVGGKRFERDLILYSTGKVRSNWWRKEGHVVSLEDLSEILADPPDVLVIGTGYYGFVKVTEGAREGLKRAGVELVEAATKRACDLYNELCRSGRKVAAALHLTC